jgi:hypothetical protein
MQTSHPKYFLMAILLVLISSCSNMSLSLRPSASLLFYALPSSYQKKKNSSVTALFEYRLYSTEQQLQEREWIRTEKSLCLVWKAPSEELLIDSKAKPAFRQ